MAAIKPKLLFARRKRRIRHKLKTAKTELKTRLAVFRSNQHIYAQIISEDGSIVAAASTLDKKIGKLKSASNKEAAQKVGELIAEKAKAKKITTVVFDRSGYLFHGRVKALADAAREKGLKF